MCESRKEFECHGKNFENNGKDWRVMTKNVGQCKDLEGHGRNLESHSKDWRVMTKNALVTIQRLRIMSTNLPPNNNCLIISSEKNDYFFLKK